MQMHIFVLEVQFHSHIITYIITSTEIILYVTCKYSKTSILRSPIGLGHCDLNSDVTILTELMSYSFLIWK